jgi:hypothetical protein
LANGVPQFLNTVAGRLVARVIPDGSPAQIEEAFELVDGLFENIVVKPWKSSILDAQLRQDLGRGATLNHGSDNLALHIRRCLGQCGPGRDGDLPGLYCGHHFAGTPAKDGHGQLNDPLAHPELLGGQSGSLALGSLGGTGSRLLPFHSVWGKLLPDQPRRRHGALTDCRPKWVGTFDFFFLKHDRCFPL